MSLEIKKDSMAELVLATGAGVGCIVGNGVISALTGWNTVAIFSFGILTTGTCGYLITKKIKEDKLKWNRLFRNCNIKNKDDMMPKLIKRISKMNTLEYIFTVPYGLSEDDFEKKRLAIECALKSDVEVRRSKNVVILTTNLDCEW